MWATLCVTFSAGALVVGGIRCAWYFVAVLELFIVGPVLLRMSSARVTFAYRSISLPVFFGLFYRSINDASFIEIEDGLKISAYDINGVRKANIMVLRIGIFAMPRRRLDAQLGPDAWLVRFEALASLFDLSLRVSGDAKLLYL